MTNVPEENRCPRCGGSTAPAASGRITQWVVACTCKLADQATTEAETSAITSVVICQGCGKRMEQGRVGSFTQWVFRSDICSCQNPQPLTQEIQVSTAPQIALEDEDLQREPGLEIEPDKFPHERYNPLSLIGKGASGTVYLCWDKILAKRVAIKVLHHLHASQMVAFQQEARTMSRLSHDNIIRILDFGITTGGVPFMVMELVKGASLMNYIIEFERIQPAAALYFLHQICKGLGHAHREGVFHRDIKSSNILISNLGTEHADAKLIDFGVAGRKDSLQGTTNSTAMVGSPGYMAPDMALGLDYSERSEIYSLGCCLFEALTGVLPFHGESPLEVLNQQASDEAPCLNDMASDLEFSDELARLVARCLRKDPAERYENTMALAEALESLPEYQGKEVVVQPQESLDMTGMGVGSVMTLSGPDSAKKPFWKNPLVMLSFAAAIISGAIVLVALQPQETYTTESRLFSTVWNEPAGDKLPEQVLGSPLVRGTKKPYSQKEIDKAMDDTETVISDVLKKQVYGPTNTKVKKPHRFLTKPQKDQPPAITGEGDVRDNDLVELKNKKFSSLTLDQCALTGVGLKYIRNSGVKTLMIESSTLTDEGMKEIGQIKTLTLLYIRENPITSNGFKYLVGLPLRGLFVRGCRIDDSAIEFIGKIKTLELLELCSTDMTVKALGDKLTELPNLEFLDVSKLRDSSSMEGIEHLGQIEYLKADEMKLNDQALKRISQLPKLIMLDVQYNHITDAGLIYLIKAPSLRRLNISHSSLCTPSGAARLKQLKPGLDIIERFD